MHEKLGLFILLVCLVRNAISEGPESCHVDNSYYYTGVKTPYDKIYNGTEDHQVDLPGKCSLLHWNKASLGSPSARKSCNASIY
jgi:hypothetical protein